MRKNKLTKRKKKSAAKRGEKRFLRLKKTQKEKYLTKKANSEDKKKTEKKQNEEVEKILKSRKQEPGSFSPNKQVPVTFSQYADLVFRKKKLKEMKKKRQQEDIEEAAE